MATSTGETDVARLTTAANLCNGVHDSCEVRAGEKVDPIEHAVAHNRTSAGRRTHLLGIPSELRESIYDFLVPIELYGEEREVQDPTDTTKSIDRLEIQSNERLEACDSLLIVCKHLGHEVATG